MEPLDYAVERLRSIRDDVAAYKETIISEQDTRIKVIDRVLTEVLGWSLPSIETEVRAGAGFIDYKLAINGFARLIVEAKRDDRVLGTERRIAGRPFKLCGPVFNTPAAKEGIEQAIRYCGQKNAELACVTNGREWIAFRGSRLGDGRDTSEGMAFVFPSLDAAIDSFATFYDLLSFEAVQEYRYRPVFQEAEGRPIRSNPSRKVIRPASSRNRLQPSPLSGDLDRVMVSFFRRLSGDDDPDLLLRCFVETTESRIADRKIARISEDLIGAIRHLDTARAEQLTELIERVRSTHRNQFVLLVGTKSAGKSTFIERFFRYVLPKELLKDCVVARVDLADNGGDEATLIPWLDRYLLAALESSVFGCEPPTYDELQGMFFDEYQRRSTGALKHLYERDKEQFKIEFGQYIEKTREDRPHDYIRRMVRHIVTSRTKIPCIIFDNADQFTTEYQERAFQYARSIYESEVCLVIMPITDRTSWQISREGALRSFENESLFLPSPDPSMVIRKRIEFLEERVSREQREPGTGYFIGRGIKLSIEDLTAFTAALHQIFLNSKELAGWIGSLANNDVRRCLEICKNVVTSPHLAVDELIKAYVSNSSWVPPPHKLKRALFKGQHDIYSLEVNPFVQNVFELGGKVSSSPLTGLRLLLLLKDAQADVPSRNYDL